MITDSFDNKSKPILDVNNFYEVKDRNDLICVVTYSYRALNYFLKNYKHKIVAYSNTSNGPIPIYSFLVNKKEYLFYMTPIGATTTAGLMYETMALTGCHRFVFFGSCGTLNYEKTKGKTIVPTSSYNDVGISYHYAEPTDFVEVKNAKVISKILKRLEIPYVEGKIWTTDAVYMETENKVNQHKKEGCIAVDMEIAGIQTVANYYDIDIYPVLFTGDDLSGDKWKQNHLGGEKETKAQCESLLVALLIAENI